MKETDIRIIDIRVTFTGETFRYPLALSTGAITDITYADVRIVVENRCGMTAEGVGGILLSDLWAFPEPTLGHEMKDRFMRRLVLRWSELLHSTGEYADPIQHAHRMEACLSGMLLEVGKAFGLQVNVPKLAGLVTWSPFDAALHDGWARAAGRNVYTMYTRDYLNEDLSHYLGPDWQGMFPGDFLRLPVEKLWMQHVVGGKDPLTLAEIPADMSAVDDGLPIALTDWIRRDRVRWFKLKTKGADVAADLERIVDVYRVAAETAAVFGIKEPVMFEIDPNEGCPDPEPMLELLRKLRERSTDAYEALKYIEQPTTRRLSEYRYTLHDVSELKPVLADESLDDLANLPDIVRTGFNGVALKTCKGHSHTLLTYCWAKREGLYVTVQDLTNPGYSLVHSAGLCSRLRLMWDCCEANSRQYIPFSRPEERRWFPKVFVSCEGQLDVSQLRNPGLY